MSLIFVDCEAYGPTPRLGRLTEFGAVEYKTGEHFHGKLIACRPSAANPAVPEPAEDAPVTAAEYNQRGYEVFGRFRDWLAFNGEGRPVFVSDNPAFDWMWISDGLWRWTNGNPFGHSARRLADFYAGLVGDFHQTQKWKRLRVTPHDHNPVNDARGNVEALRRLLAGERP